MKPSNPKMIPATDATNNPASSAIDAQFIVSGSIQAIFSGSSLGGTLTLQGSNDPIDTCLVAGVPTPTHWSTIGTPSTVASSALTVQTVAQLNYRWIRVIWVNSAGTGTITVNGNFQGF